MPGTTYSAMPAHDRVRSYSLQTWRSLCRHESGQLLEHLPGRQPRDLLLADASLAPVRAQVPSAPPPSREPAVLRPSEWQPSLPAWRSPRVVSHDPTHRRPTHLQAVLAMANASNMRPAVSLVFFGAWSATRRSAAAALITPRVLGLAVACGAIAVAAAAANDYFDFSSGVDVVNAPTKALVECVPARRHGAQRVVLCASRRCARCRSARREPRLPGLAAQHAPRSCPSVQQPPSSLHAV